MSCHAKAKVFSPALPLALLAMHFLKRPSIKLTHTPSSIFYVTPQFVCTQAAGKSEYPDVPTLDPAKTIIDDKMTRHGSINDDARYASAAVGELYCAKANNIVPFTTSSPAQADPPTGFPSSIGFASASEELRVCSATPGKPNTPKLTLPNLTLPHLTSPNLT